LKLDDVLVTGGHGFIGQHVVAALARAGTNPVSVAQSGGTMLADQPGESIALDLEDWDRLKEVVGGVDGVVHLAARAGGIQFQAEGESDVFSSNRLITDNLLAACAEAKVRRVFLASSLVTYLASSHPLTESDPQLGPANRPDPYAWSKITDEVVASWHRELDIVVGRFGNVYGPGAPFEPDRSTVVHALVDRAAKLGDGEDLVVWGDGTAVRSFVFVEDAADAVLIALADGAHGEAYNIDSGVEATIAQLATAVRDQVNPTLNLIFDPARPTGTSYRVASIAKLSAIGYAPRINLEEGLRRTVDWYRENVASP
jgi:nucleoside-diphosphate-sugar epimerase